MARSNRSRAVTVASRFLGVDRVGRLRADANTSAETCLGFIPEDASLKELTDVPLPDSVYEIEARPSQCFWNERRGWKIVNLVGGTVGGGTTTTGLPANTSPFRLHADRSRPRRRIVHAVEHHRPGQLGGSVRIPFIVSILTQQLT